MGKAPVKPILLVLGLVAAVAVAIAYAAHAAGRPSSVIEQAFARALQLQSVGFDMQSKPADHTTKAATWRLTGRTDRQGQLDAQGSYQAVSGQKLTFSLRSTSASGTGSTTYARLQGAEYLPALLGDMSRTYGLPGGGSPLQALNNRWVEVPSFLQQAVVRDWVFIGKTGRGTHDLSLADQQQLASLYQRHAFIKVSDNLGDATLDGSATHHYRLRFDQIALSAYLQSVQRSIGQLQVTADQISQAITTTDNMHDVQIWIDRKDGNIRQLQFDHLDNGQHSIVTLRLHDFDRPFTVAKPTDSTPLLTALTALQAPGKAVAPSTR